MFQCFLRLNFLGSHYPSSFRTFVTACSSHRFAANQHKMQALRQLNAVAGSTKPCSRPAVAPLAAVPTLVVRGRTAFVQAPQRLTAVEACIGMLHSLVLVHCPVICRAYATDLLQCPDLWSAWQPWMMRHKMLRPVSSNEGW
jgi:hypothetical protein